MTEEDELTKEIEQEYWEKNYPDLVQKIKMGIITKEEAEILSVFDTVEQRELVLAERRDIEKKGNREFRNYMRSKYRFLVNEKFDTLMKELGLYGMEIEKREKTIIIREFDWNNFGNRCLEDVLKIERRCNSSGDSESKFIEEWDQIIESFIEKRLKELLIWNKTDLQIKPEIYRDSRNNEDKTIVDNIRREADGIMRALGKIRVKKINELNNQNYRMNVIGHIKLWNMLTYENLVKYGKIDEIVVRKAKETKNEGF